MTTDTTLEGRRAGLEAKLERLRLAPEAADLVRKADEALAHYRDQIAALEGEMAKIDEELGVREMDRRAVAAKEREDKWHAQRQALIAEEEVRLKAVADAEAAARALVDALNRTFASNARLAKIAHDLSTTHKVPTALNANDLVMRMAGRLAGVMKTIRGHPHRLGQLEWPGGSLYPPDRCWRDDEERRIAVGVVQPHLEKGKV
jgi:hypothetical protein